MKRHFNIKLLSAAISFFFCGCFCFKNATPPELEQLGFKACGKTPGVFRHPAGGVLKLTPEKRLCIINGRQFYLPHPVTLDADGRCRVSELSISKVIKPLFSPDPRQKQLIRTVILDPGHGDHNFGAVGVKYKEKDLNLSLAKEIAKSLKKRGFDVRLTRADDRFLTLEERGKMARRKNGDLFLSIHHNASPNKTSRGVETYIVTPGGSASSNDNAAQIHTDPVPGNQFDEFNIRLAAGIQDHLIRGTKRIDRGVRFARFKVLVLSDLPGALIEAGFVSESTEELLCGDKAEQKKTAEAIAEAILQLNKQNSRQVPAGK